MHGGAFPMFFNPFGFGVKLISRFTSSCLAIIGHAAFLQSQSLLDLKVTTEGRRDKCLGASLRFSAFCPTSPLLHIVSYKTSVFAQHSTNFSNPIAVWISFLVLVV